MTTNLGWFVFLLLGCLVWLVWAWQRHQHPASHPAAVKARLQWLLKPRTPHDCPICRQQAAHPTETGSPRPQLIPWRERKSRRGRPKRITTQGFACPNRTCTYFQISDAQFHALVGDGVDGTSERIQSLRCQACNTTFSTRRGYPLGDAAVPPQNRIPARR